MYFYTTLIISVLFLQYASEMRRVPETLAAREETWVYQILNLTKKGYNSTKQFIKSKTTGENNDQIN